MQLIAWLMLIAQAAAAPPASSRQSVSGQPEIYFIYSSMITSRMSQQRGSDEIYLIQQSTVTDSGPPSCVKAPQEDAAALAEISAEYSRRAGASEVLDRRFTLPLPYELLDRDTAAKFLKDALDSTPQVPVRPGGNTAPPANSNPLFPKAKQLFRLSEVYFDKTHSFALAWAGIYSTTVDYMGTWRPYKKSATGVWEENRAWTACGQGAIR